MKKAIPFFLFIILPFYTCGPSANENSTIGTSEGLDKDKEGMTAGNPGNKPSITDVPATKKTNTEYLSGLLPARLKGFDVAQPVMRSPDDDQVISVSRQFLDNTYKKYVKIVITERPQPPDEFDKTWEQNKSFENGTKKVTAKFKNGIGIYEVVMKDNSQMLFNTFYVDKRFEVYVEIKGLDDIQYTYDFTEDIVHKLNTMDK